MDPKACWARFIDACCDNDREEGLAALEDLLEWGAGGGFWPTGIPPVAVLETLRDVFEDAIQLAQ